MATRQQNTGSGGMNAPRGRPVAGDFKPNSQWKSQDDSRILVLNLPGFKKEQIKVSTEGTNTLRISGERLVEGNKWSRFKEDFDIPKECDIKATRARFEGATETLTITMPKKPQVDLEPKPTPKPISEEGEAKTTTLEPPTRPQHDTTDKPKYDKVREDPKARLTSDAKRRSKADDKINTSTTTTTTVRTPSPKETTARTPLPGEAQNPYIITPLPKMIDQPEGAYIDTPRPKMMDQPQGAYVDTPRPEMIANSENEYGKKGLKESTPQKAIVPATPDLKTISSPGGAVVVEKQPHGKEGVIGSKTNAAKSIVEEEGNNVRKESDAARRPKMPELVMEKPTIMQIKDKESSNLKIKPENVVANKIVEKEKDGAEGTAGAQKKEKAKDYSDVAKEKQTADASSSSSGRGGDRGSVGHFDVEKYKQAVKEVAKGAFSMNEERQLMVNIGAALLVIVGLGVYIYYN